MSDHAPILLTTGMPRLTCIKRFKFELGWLHPEGFQEMVKKIGGKGMLLVILQFRGMNTKFVQPTDTLLVGHITQRDYVAKKRND